MDFTTTTNIGHQLMDICEYDDHAVLQVIEATLDVMTMEGGHQHQQTLEMAHALILRATEN